MRSIKILIQALIFVALIVVIIQNIDVFTYEFELGLDLEVWSSGTFIIKNIVLIASSFLLGVILTIFWGAFSSASKSSTIKQQKKKIKELESSKPETASTYSAEETVSSEAHEVPSASNDPFKSPS
ncbi:MAG TPA: lipopolysaccharide assembly protein LapA domain-containing protein [Thermodesulfobacteriota bacterium]|nr:lipopolysaccharide assembly protein LapA domain-containing protein [Thermodesulfobacteriota bacterium]